MKKILCITFAGFCSIIATAQTTATNFNCNDCAASNHELFAELNAGKVIVISWVMPCASCIAPSLSAYTEVQNYQTSNPGRVFFYIADDVANTNCATLTSWATTNGMPNATIFSNAAISMTNYGTSGMPKIVVLGGSNHTVFFNQNNGLNVTNFNNAINQALNATTGIFENSENNFQTKLFPNPVNENKTNLSFYLSSNSDVNYEIYNTLGAKVKSVSLGNQTTGKHEIQLDCEHFSNGIYYLKLNMSSSSQMSKFTVAH